MSAKDTMREICKELADQGIWPPYTLNIGDGEGNEVALNVICETTMTNIRVVDKAPEEYSGSAESLEGAERVKAVCEMIGDKVEIVQHEGTYYVV